LSKTAVNAGWGAPTQLSGLAAATVTVLTMLFLTGLFEDLPEATLGAVVIAALIELVDVRSLIRLYRLSTSRLGRIYGAAARPDFIAAVAAMLGVLIFDTLPGLFIGIAVSLLLLVYRSSYPNVATLGRAEGSDLYTDMDRHPENTTVPGVVILRIESALFFGNADGVGAWIRAQARAPGVTTVVLDAESIPFVDFTAITALRNTAQDLEGSGVHLVIAHDIGQVRDLFEAAGAQEILEHLYPSVQAAVDAVT
jgi:SulP family sulfate permease